VKAPPIKIGDPESIARAFHETYERLAPSFGYETREASAKPWGQVPENNRALMTAVAAEVAPLIAAQVLRSQDQEHIEWGVQWHGGGVIHGRNDLGREAYDEETARATADRYTNAKAVFRRAAGPWTACWQCRDSGQKCGYCGTGLWPNDEPDPGALSH
jgi:hypothetical protein